MYIHVVVSSHVKGNLVMKSYFGGRVEVFPSYAGKKICGRKQIIKPLNQIRPDEDEVLDALIGYGLIIWMSARMSTVLPSVKYEAVQSNQVRLVNGHSNRLICLSIRSTRRLLLRTGVKSSPIIMMTK